MSIAGWCHLPASREYIQSHVKREVCVRARHPNPNIFGQEQKQFHVGTWLPNEQGCIHDWCASRALGARTSMCLKSEVLNYVKPQFCFNAHTWTDGISHLWCVCFDFFVGTRKALSSDCVVDDVDTIIQRQGSRTSKQRKMQTCDSPRCSHSRAADRI